MTAVAKKSEWPEFNRENARNFYYTHWNTKGVMPSVAEVAAAFNQNMVVVQNFVDDDAFRKHLVIRGLPLSKRSVLNPDQLKCIVILTDPTVKGGLRERLKLAGVHYNTYRSWMQMHEFKDAFTKLAEQILDNSLADVNQGLVQAANRGDVAAIKFYYEVTGRYNPQDRQVMDVMAVLSGVVEIIQRRITDPTLLSLLATDLQNLSTTSGVPGTIRGTVLGNEG